MKTFLFIFLLIFNYLVSYSQSVENNQLIDFISRFPKIQTPVTTDEVMLNYNNNFKIDSPNLKIISQKYVEDFICDSKNLCGLDISGEKIRYEYLSKVTSDKYLFLFVLETTERWERKIEMLIYSTKPVKKVNKLIVQYNTPWDKGYIKSKISANNDILIDYVFSLERSEEAPVENNNKYFNIVTNQEKYKINFNCVLEKVFEKGREKILAIYNSELDKIEFPVQLPK